MLRRILGSILFALFVQGIQCQNDKPPKLTDSYMAWGEITQPIQDLAGAEMQIHFEETYNKDNENAAFVVWLAGKNVTFVKNFKTKQTFRYTEGKECVQTDEEEWIKSEYPPGLLNYEDDDGTIKFSLRQLFNLPDGKLSTSIKQGEREKYRGIPARKWVYQINGRDQKGYKKRLFIYSYWSDNADGKWNTSSNAKSIPLGFVVSKTGVVTKFTIEETVTNVYGFISGAYDHKLFEPYQGVICANKTQTYKFPDVKNIKAVSLHSEMVLPDYQEIKYIDTWFDPINQLQRVDVERIKLENPMEERKTKRFESETAIGKMGIVYRVIWFKGKSQCEIIPFKQYENDVQNFFNIKEDLKKWKMGRLFGLNETTYVYTGKTTKADVPCHVFQGIRTDWPEKSANVTSLWEWCFNANMSKEGEIVQFLNNEFGLINAQVTIISSDKPMDFPPGFRMFHHFYQVTPKEPEILDATKFDISICYNYTQRRYLQFYLDWEVTKDNRHIAENLTSDVQFLQKWKSAIYLHSELPDYSLRVTAVRSTISDKKLYIRFLILGLHEKLPPLEVEQIAAFKAEENLRDKVNKGLVAIRYIKGRDKTATVFRAAKHSVDLQMNPDIKMHTLTPLPTTKPTKTTPYHFTLITDPDDVKSSVTGDGKVTGATGSVKPDQKTTPTPEKEGKISKETRHQPGTVATVSIAMLLIGISVGCSGTFYKFFGLPSCLKSQQAT